MSGPRYGTCWFHFPRVLGCTAGVVWFVSGAMSLVWLWFPSRCQLSLKDSFDNNISLGLAVEMIVVTYCLTLICCCIAMIVYCVIEHVNRGYDQERLTNMDRQLYSEPVMEVEAATRVKRRSST